jgi:transposase
VGHARARKIPARLVEDEDYQLRHERVAGIDVAKAKADVCTRLPPARDGGRRASRVEEVPARARDILDLGGRLLADGVELVIMESTSDYWRIWYYLLESLGLKVQLVNSRHARQLAGRPKTDRLDAQWIARLAEMGLLRPSFVPPPEIRALRSLTRGRQQAARDKAREWQRLEKVLEDALVKLSSVLSSLARTQAARAILQAIAEGQDDPAVLAGLAAPHAGGGRKAIAAALEGMQARDHHRWLIAWHLRHITLLERQVAAFDDEIAAALDAIPAAWGASAAGERAPGAGLEPGDPVLPAARRLAEVPGISLDMARAVIAETGLDMTVFPTPAHLASWAGLAPVASSSGTRSGHRKGHGNTVLKGHLTQASLGASRTETFLGARYRRLSRRLGGNRACCAVARSILTIIWHLLNDPGARYTDLGAGWHARKADRDRQAGSHVRHLQALGYTVHLTEATA